MAHRILLMLYMDAGSPQHLYQVVQNYVMIGLMNISWSKPSYNIIPNNICIIFWKIMCMVSIKEYIIPDPPFQSSGTHWILMNR